MSEDELNLNEKNSFDAIIIGSGIGGLTVASLMAQLLKKKVLVLEKHSKLGGFTHSFGKMGKWRWDVGLHYVGDMHPKSTLRKLFDFVTGGKLEWQNFPDPFQYYVYPDFKFAVSSSPQKYQTDLVNLFQAEKLAIEQYFLDIKRVRKAYLILRLKENNLIKSCFFRFSPQTKVLLQISTKDYLQTHFRDPKLIALLDSQWGDLGLPSADNPFFNHAMLVSHYLRGAYYPKGGAHKIAETIIECIRNHGGESKTFAKVDDLLLDRHKTKITGCRYIEKRNTPEGIKETVKEVYAPLVVSNVGARLTYGKWINKYQITELGQKIANLPPGLSVVCVYVGLRANPSQMGIRGENFWLFANYDHNQMARDCDQVIQGKPQMAFVSFGGSHNPETQNFTAQIITFIHPKVFDSWKNTEFQNRGTEYKELKNKMAQALIDFANERIPGFRDLVEFIEIGTPLSVTHYTDQPFGEIYGIAGAPGRFAQLKELGAQTPIRNLYLTGADVSSAGIAGALFGGIVTFYHIALKDLLSMNLVKTIALDFFKKYNFGKINLRRQL